VKESFGAEYVAQVLTGSQEARIIDNGHDKLSTWGLLKEDKKTYVRDWIEQLTSQGYLERIGEYNVLKVTPQGWDVLHGKTAPRLLKAVVKKTTVRTTKSGAISWEGVDTALFERLRQLRRQIASDHNVPPFIVFSDTTLRDLARQRPTTLAGFRLVHGVGDKKTTEYGAIFIEAITKDAAGRGLATDIVSKTPRQDVAPTEAVSFSAARQKAFDLFREGKSPEDVCKATDRAPSTVMQYLVEYINQTELSDCSAWVDDATVDKIRAARRQSPDDRLKPIFDALEGTASYDTIRIVLACMRHEPSESFIDSLDFGDQ
jgi:ATP-dependent DNA helicase RecQ